MEALESLLFGIEPLTALAVGVGAILLPPAIGAIASNFNQEEEAGTESSDQSTENPVSQAFGSAGDAARGFAKDAIVWGFDVVENVQTAFAEASESFQDFMAESKAEHETKKADRQTADAGVQPRTVDIAGE